MDNVQHVLQEPTAAQMRLHAQAALPIHSLVLEQVRAPAAQAERLRIR